MVQARRVPVFDLRSTPHDGVLAHVERAFDTVLDRRSVVRGAHGATEGFRSDRDTWVRIEQRPSWRIKSAAWIGLEASSTIENVPMPRWFQGVTWAAPEHDLVWRADEVEYVSAPSVRSAGDLEAAKALPDNWWAGMRKSLKALGEHQTERVGVTQEHLSRRISQVFKGVDTEVYEWSTAHADLHWANVTTTGTLLDWEDWGLAPRGHDAATLWQASLPDPELAAKVQRVFADELRNRSARLSQLMHCANVIRIATDRGIVTPFLEPAKTAAEVLVRGLRELPP